jgi:hypothetical protein
VEFAPSGVSGSTQKTEDGLESPNGFRSKSEREREAGGVTGPFSSIWMKKKRSKNLPEDIAGDALRREMYPDIENSQLYIHVHDHIQLAQTVTPLIS